MAPRKKRCRHISTPPQMSGYYPERSIYTNAGINILFEEYEALRLADYEGLKHDEAAIKMNISRPTFARIYESVRKKIAMAFVESRPIHFEVGSAFFSGVNKDMNQFNFSNQQINNMKKILAIPSENGVLSNHFGHASEFAFVECEGTEVKSVKMQVPPPHEPGILPKWVAEQGGNVVIAGGMGHKAIDIFQRHGVDVVTGAESLPVEELARQFVEGTLTGSGNKCDH
ncbi:MAG: hypothetical protein C0599_15740 [Salinivirgaceae bacterium]|mgnify:CR=1 FL=1|nr:MAG: hypothetical protein C0599_15740 [Salinivirgaceae bacterium]